MKRLTSLSAVVPVYNSEESLQLLCDELSAVLPDVSDTWEILLVNDGSTDGSWSIIRDLSSREPHVRGINLWRNFGQHPALLCGIRRARSEFVVTLDDDLQYHPKDIPKLVGAMVDGVDVVYGSTSHTEHGLWRRVASRVLRWGLEMAVGVTVARSLAAQFGTFEALRRAGTDDLTADYVTVATVWARLRAIAGGLLIEGVQDTERITHRFDIRYRTDQPSWGYIETDGRRFAVRAGGEHDIDPVEHVQPSAAIAQQLQGGLVVPIGHLHAFFYGALQQVADEVAVVGPLIGHHLGALVIVDRLARAAPGGEP
ncbi:MAG: phage head closure protein, partial [Gemmatimonadetes bacterium]|nr:phage head closure protein [Gemmatimonadota bacterium]